MHMDMTDGVFYAKAAALIGAALVMGLGTLGPALGQGMIGSKGCENIGKYPENANDIRNAMFIGLVMVETSAIYCFLVAGGLIAVAAGWIGRI